jgi:hypothetical protein
MNTAKNEDLESVKKTKYNKTKDKERSITLKYFLLYILEKTIKSIEIGAIILAVVLEFGNPKVKECKLISLTTPTSLIALYR